MSTNELQARLNQMRRTETEGRKAENILRCVAAFHGSFTREAIAKVVSYEIFQDVETLLCQWQWITPVTDEQFSINDEELREILPPIPRVLARHFAYYEEIFDQANIDPDQSFYHRLMKEDERNILGALDWAIDHSSMKAIRFLSHIDRYFDRPLVQLVPRLRRLYPVLDRGHFHPHSGHMAERLGDLAWQVHEDDLVYGYYALAVWLYTSTRSPQDHQIQALEKALTYARSQDQFDRAIAHLHQVWGVHANFRNYPVILRELGLNCAQEGDLAKARGYFTQALRLAEGESLPDMRSSTILWAWGQMEYRSGNCGEGLILCRLALTTERAALEKDHWGAEAHARHEDLSHQFALMTCEEEA